MSFLKSWYGSSIAAYLFPRLLWIQIWDSQNKVINAERLMPKKLQNQNYRFSSVSKLSKLHKIYNVCYETIKCNLFAYIWLKYHLQVLFTLIQRDVFQLTTFLHILEILASIQFFEGENAACSLYNDAKVQLNKISLVYIPIKVLFC